MGVCLHLHLHRVNGRNEMSIGLLPIPTSVKRSRFVCPKIGWAEREISFVESCDRAAVQFGVGIDMPWMRRFRQTGSVAPGSEGRPQAEVDCGRDGERLNLTPACG